MILAFLAPTATQVWGGFIICLWGYKMYKAPGYKIYTCLLCEKWEGSWLKGNNNSRQLQFFANMAPTALSKLPWCIVLVLPAKFRLDSIVNTFGETQILRMKTHILYMSNTHTRRAWNWFLKLWVMFDQNTLYLLSAAALKNIPDPLKVNRA